MLDALTAREEEVAALAARGLTSKQIARVLGDLSPATVGYHLGSIFRKLHIGSRRELGRRCVLPLPRRVVSRFYRNMDLADAAE